MSEASVPAFHEHYLWCIHPDKSKVFGVLDLPVAAEDVRSELEFPTVVLAHDAGADHAQLAPVSEALASAKVVAYAIDLRGGGPACKSDAPACGDATEGTASADLARAADLMLEEHFCDRAELFLCGRGLAAAAAASEAARRPGLYRGLVLVDAPARACEPPEGLATLRLASSDAELPAKVAGFVNDVIRNRWGRA